MNEKINTLIELKGNKHLSIPFTYYLLDSKYNDNYC